MSHFSSPPPSIADILVTFPHPHVMLVTINRPKQLNSLGRAMHYQLDGLWKWYDAEPWLRCAVITGRGRAFCAGADLKEWNDQHAVDKPDAASTFSDGGFGGLSNRRGKKPVVAAVNGPCLGGGMEMVLNADLVVASANATFALPEVARGVVPIQGALPRLMRSVGMQRAAEMALLARTYSAADMLRWGLANSVVPAGRDVVEEALQWAVDVAVNSPDSVIVAREGLLAGWEPESPVASTRRIQRDLYPVIDAGDNMKEGVCSFVERRKPVWRDSKL